MQDLARDVLEISESGLRARARPGAGGMIIDERHFLNALHDSIETGQVPADELLECYHGEWGGDLSRIYDAFSY
jgi:glutamate--cysteine ligase